MVIMMIGYVVRRGFYIPDAMQVFNRGQIGGAYWFIGGWNLAGMSGWVVASTLALLAVNTPGHFVGPLGNLGAGIDLSLVAALILPAILYPLALYVFPEPRGVYGPEGARFTRTVDTPIAPVVDAAGS